MHSIADSKTQSEVREHFKKRDTIFPPAPYQIYLEIKCTRAIYTSRAEKKRKLFVIELNPPLIEQELFKRVQEILEEKLITNGFVKAKCFNEPHLFRRFCDAIIAKEMVIS